MGIEVPCNGCVRCCIGDAVRILSHEDHTQWVTEPHFKIEGARMLAHKPNGECVYLGQYSPTGGRFADDRRGCTIHSNRPEQCHTMDCRNIAKNVTFTQARKLTLPLAVWRKGRELLKAGDAP